MASSWVCCGFTSWLDVMCSLVYGAHSEDEYDCSI